MEKLVIEGGQRLEGEIPTSGSKNAALPILAACLLTDEPMTIHRIPRVRDIRTMERLMSHIGASLTRLPNGPHRILCDQVADPVAPYDLVKTMRASSLVLGPLVGRC
jgi:UDP-N-acetylglucosamine 1-carboxyvinyltransferase